MCPGRSQFQGASCVNLQDNLELGDGGMDLPNFEKKAPFLELFNLLFVLVQDFHQIRSSQNGETTYSHRESTVDM